MKTSNELDPIRAKISGYTSKAVSASTIHNAQQFYATIQVQGIDVTGEPFRAEIHVDHRNEEFREFINMYGATVIAKKLQLMHQLAEKLPYNAIGIVVPVTTD